MQINCDLHIHTPLSKCCHDTRQSPPVAAAYLMSIGMKRIAFTDHVWLNPLNVPGARYDSSSGRSILALKEGIRNLQLPIDVLVGCEADMCAPECFAIDMEQREDFDLVLLASNHFQLRDFVQQPDPVGGVRALTALMLDFFKAAASSGLGDVLVHPLMPLGYMEYAEAVHRSIEEAQLFDLLSIAAETGSAIEINGAILSKWYNAGFSEELLLRLFETARQAGCSLVFGSDAHTQDVFVERYRMFSEIADKLRLNTEDLSPWVNAPLVEC